jgi:hypothetical protein
MGIPKRAASREFRRLVLEAMTTAASETGTRANHARCRPGEGRDPFFNRLGIG